MQRRKPLREKRKKGKLKNKLVYGIAAVGLVFICFIVYSLFHPENPSTNNQTGSPKAALIDHLSFSSPPSNETFKTKCETILENAGFEYTYYEGEEVTVDFYRELPTYEYDLIILRVHSATISNKTSEGPFLGFFTSEIYDESDLTPEQRNELQQARLAIAFFPGESEKKYFGITEWFVRDRMVGNFKDTVIIMMGCEGLNRTSMAEEFRQKGAKVYISWTGPVAISHTDDATIRLLQYLLQQNQTIRTAVEWISHDPTWTWSKLDYYPNKGDEDVGSKVLRNFISGLTPRIADMSVICYKFCLFSSSRRFEAMK